MTVTDEGGATGFSRVGGQDTARYPAAHREQLPATKNHLVQKLKKAGVENLSSTHTDMVFVFVYKEVSTKGLALTEKLRQRTLKAGLGTGRYT